MQSKEVIILLNNREKNKEKKAAIRKCLIELNAAKKTMLSTGNTSQPSSYSNSFITKSDELCQLLQDFMDSIDDAYFTSIRELACNVNSPLNEIEEESSTYNVVVTDNLK